MAARRVLVLGAYGLIGAAITRALIAAGHDVTGLGRDAAMAARVLPGVPFHVADMAEMVTPESWEPLLAQADIVVNCAGALQDGPRDHLAALQAEAVTALAQAAAQSGTGVVQISAVGAVPDAPTDFMATKAQGDAALLASGAPVWILRPGLVLAPTAYGGTVLLRMLAAVPLVQPLALPDARIQVVDVADVAQAVCRAVAGKVAPGRAYDLVAPHSHSLSELAARLRAHLGFAAARVTLRLPDALLSPVTGVADALGRLGWRSPLRRNALASLRAGITGDPGPWSAQAGALAGLNEILARHPAGVERRLHARAALLMPLCVAVLALFWAVSGLIGIVERDASAHVLEQAGWRPGLARAAVLFWALVDLALAAAILWRPWAARACWAMVAVSLIYLGPASVVTPWLWTDPLGPLVKVLPALVLALVTRVLLEAR